VRLVQFIDVVLFSPSLSPFLPCRRFSILLSAALCRAAPRGGSRGAPMRGGGRGRGEGRGVPRRVLSILCIVEQLRPTPRIRAICEYTFSSATLLGKPYSIVLPPSLSVFLPFYFFPLFLPLSLCSLLFAALSLRRARYCHPAADIISCSVGLQMHPR